MKLLIGVALAVLASGTTEERAAATTPDVTWFSAPVFVPPADCNGEGICSSPNSSCKALDNEYCNASLPNVPSGCKDPDMAGRDAKTDPNGDCCWCLYDT